MRIDEKAYLAIWGVVNNTILRANLGRDNRNQERSVFTDKEIYDAVRALHPKQITELGKVMQKGVIE